MTHERGFTYLELLAAALILAVASAGALATWHISSRAPANKRVTEMGVYIATQQIERLKARRYLGLPDGSANPPAYYDRYGAPAAGPAAQGYRAEWSVTPVIDRDGIVNSEDVREVRVQVWDNGKTRRYEDARVLIAFGGS